MKLALFLVGLEGSGNRMIMRYLEAAGKQTESVEELVVRVIHGSEKGMLAKGIDNAHKSGFNCFAVLPVRNPWCQRGKMGPSEKGGEFPNKSYGAVHYARRQQQVRPVEDWNHTIEQLDSRAVNVYLVSFEAIIEYPYYVLGDIAMACGLEPITPVEVVERSNDRYLTFEGMCAAEADRARD